MNLKNSAPKECQIWKGDATDDRLNSWSLQLEVLKTYCDDDHNSRRLVRCKECGHLYFREFLELLDYTNGNDAQYATWIPVDDVESADYLSTLDVFAILLEPKVYLKLDFPSDATNPKVQWIR